MPFCPNCKVSLAPNATVCPLCKASAVPELNMASGKGTSAAASAAASAARKPEASPVTSPAVNAPSTQSDVFTPISFSTDQLSSDSGEIISPIERRMISFELVSVSFGIVLAVTVGIDFLFFGGFSWSRFSSLVIITFWLWSAIPLIFWGHPWLVCAVLCPSLILCVFLWALFVGGLSWFLVPGLSITIFFEVSLVGSFTLILCLKRRGLNVVGIALVAAGLLCAGIDGSVSIFSRHALSLTWSVIVLVAVIPVAAFFFYLHYRIMNRASLRKLFRL